MVTRCVRPHLLFWMVERFSPHKLKLCQLLGSTDRRWSCIGSVQGTWHPPTPIHLREIKNRDGHVMAVNFVYKVYGRFVVEVIWILDCFGPGALSKIQPPTWQSFASKVQKLCGSQVGPWEFGKRPTKKRLNTYCTNRTEDPLDVHPTSMSITFPLTALCSGAASQRGIGSREVRLAQLAPRWHQHILVIHR